MINQTNKEQKDHKKHHVYLIQGILFVIFGIFSIALPRITAISLDLVLGCILVIIGLSSCFINLKSEASWWTYAPSILTLLIGIFMLSRPLVGIVVLSLLISVILFVKGITEIILSIHFKSISNWKWLLISGIIALLLALVAAVGFPEVGIIFLGVIIGINMLLYGIAMIALSWGAKN